MIQDLQLIYPNLVISLKSLGWSYGLLETSRLRLSLVRKLYGQSLSTIRKAKWGIQPEGSTCPSIERSHIPSPLLDGSSWMCACFNFARTNFRGAS